MASKPERIGSALAKALKATFKGDSPAPARATPAGGPPIFRTNIRNVAKQPSLDPATSAGEMQVQLLIDRASAGADHTIGWTVLKPGARHLRQRHGQCDAFFVVLKGRGHVISDLGEEPAAEGDVVYALRGAWHGFRNTSSEDVILIWGLMGAGSIEEAKTEAAQD